MENKTQYFHSRSDPRPAIRECADEAKAKGYSFFALQSYGDCYIGNDETVETYDKGGKSTSCSSGSGGEGTNYVFKLGAPIREFRTNFFICYGIVIIYVQ